MVQGNGFSKDAEMSRPPYIMFEPERRNTAVIFASPHSGRDYPWNFIRSSKLDEKTIRSSEDAFVDRLFEHAPRAGAPLLTTSVPRAYVDLNRGAEELDPVLITGARQKGHNPRISSGLGVIPRVVANGREIHEGKISMAEARQRLDNYYFPYHEKLASLMSENREEFGYSLLFDCHSMPHEALATTAYLKGDLPHIVLGDRFGAACASELMDAVEEAFLSRGLRVSRNLPFAGAHVTQKYGRPTLGHHAVQIEIDRSLYMDEQSLRPNKVFRSFRETLGQVIERLTELGRGELSLAAE